MIRMNGRCSLRESIFGIFVVLCLVAASMPGISGDPPIVIQPAPGTVKKGTPPPPTITPAAPPSVPTSGGNPAGQTVSTGKPEDPRKPIPAPLEQTKARQVIEHAFREDYAKRKSREGRLQLALKLLEEGRKTEDDMTGRYVMLQDALALGIELGEPTIVMESIEELADTHRYSLLDEKLTALKKLETTVRGTTALGELARIAMRGMLESMRRNDYLTARQFQQMAESSVRRSGLRDLGEMLKKRSAEMTELRAEFARVEPSLKQLELQPDDPGANLIAGRYYAITLGDWGTGLPHLAKTNETTLRRLAELELKSPTDAEGGLTLADGWWEYGTQMPEKTMPRTHVLRHAMEWYRRVGPQLQGLSQARVERMILEFQSLPERMTFEDQEEASEIVYLSDLTPVKIDIIRNAFGNEGKRNTGEKLTLNGRWPSKGLSTPPRARGISSVQYELPETTFKYFRAMVGVDDAVANRMKSPLTFEVWGDHQRLWKSDPITRPGVVQVCRVEILTVKHLELRVVCPGSDEYAWPIWGDARLMMR